MANMQKYTRGQIGGLTRHYERGKREDGTYYKFGNQEIDTEKTHLNYNLAPQRDGGQLSFIGKRTSEVKCHNRADVNVMCSWVITAPKGLTETEQRTFFRQAYDFLNQRYAGGSDKNVISAYVHMDEVTPHLHYAFVPVVHDKKKGIDKVSAKIAIDRRDLQTFHEDLERYMAEVFGREVGVLNEATKDGNKAINELKRGTAHAELTSIQQNITESRNILADVLLDSSVAEIERREYNKLLTEKTNINKELADKKSMIENLKAQIKKLNPCVNRKSYVGVRDFEDVLREEVKEHSSFLSGKKGKIISEKGWNTIRHLAEVGISNDYNAEVYQSKAKIIEEENQKLKENNQNLKEKVKEMQLAHNCVEVIANSPFKDELQELERKAQAWNTEQLKIRQQKEVAKTLEKQQNITLQTQRTKKRQRNDFDR